jgi:hypothetical protein
MMILLSRCAQLLKHDAETGRMIAGACGSPDSGRHQSAHARRLLRFARLDPACPG